LREIYFWQFSDWKNKEVSIGVHNSFLGIYIENLERSALKFCEISAAVSSLL